MLRKLSLPAGVRVGGVMKFGGIEAVLQPILSEALALTRFDKGNIQLRGAHVFFYSGR